MGAKDHQFVFSILLTLAQLHADTCQNITDQLYNKHSKFNATIQNKIQAKLLKTRLFLTLSEVKLLLSWIKYFYNNETEKELSVWKWHNVAKKASKITKT